MVELGFWAIARSDPDRLAVVDPDERQITAGELLRSANQLVHGLRELGLQVGDSVAIVLPNSVEVFEVYLAVLQAGWYLVPINYHLVASEIAYVLQDSEAKAFVAHERFAASCSDAAKQAGLALSSCFSVGNIPGFAPYSELKATQPSSLPADRTLGLVMNYTSGTTGRPKGIRRTMSSADPDTSAANIFSGMHRLFDIRPFEDNVHICGSPLYHTAVLVYAGGSLHIGHTVVVMDRWTPEDMLRLIERYKVTNSHMVPTQFHRLLALPSGVKERYDLSSLRHVVHGAAPCSVDVKSRMIEWWGPVIDEYYAASEGGGTSVSANDWLTRPGTVGKAWEQSEVVVLDDDGNALSSNQSGTVYMAMAGGDFYRFEYFKDSEKTEQSRRGRFFTVGDVGYLDPDGYLFLLDRKADMIISGGTNIYPAEIEAVLLSCPGVADAAVFGIPHEDWGEEVKAVVELFPDVEPGPEVARDILTFSASKLAKFKLPVTIDFIPEMPRDPNGKLYKRKLRAPYWEGRTRAI